MALIACAPAHAQNAWDLAKCRASAPPRHVCTSEHLETDLALLTAREIADFLDPEFQARELVFRREPQTHLSNPEAFDDPRLDPGIIQLLHSWAERGVLESETAAQQAAVNQAGSSLRQRVMSLSVTVEDSDSRDNRCRPANDVLRVAAIDRIIDAGVKVVSEDDASHTVSIMLTALPIGGGGCAAFLSVSLRALPSEYQRAIQSVGSKLLENRTFLTGPQSEFAALVADGVRRGIGDTIAGHDH
jgi:hypothetical protein